MDMTDFDLLHVDMAFAISQNNLNAELFTYLRQLSSRGISWGFDIVNKQLVAPKNPASPTISFTGSLTDPSDRTIPVLDLAGAGTANQVGFNLTFSSAKFVSNLTRTTYTQTAAQWVLPFTATLQQALADAGSLPPAVRTSVDGLIDTYGSVFDINQVLIDLSGLGIAGGAQSRVPDVFGDTGLGDWFLLLEGMALFVQANAATIFPAIPAASYAAIHNGETAAVPLPTATPTAAQFVIVPNQSVPGSSALVWALMVDGHPMPDTPAEDFTNVTMFADPTDTGVAILASSNFVPFVLNDVSGSLTANVTQFVQAAAIGGNATWQAASLGAPALTDGTPPVIASWTMPHQHNLANVVTEIGTFSSEADSDGSLTIGFAKSSGSPLYDQLSVSGNVTFVVEWAYDPSEGIGQAATSPTFSYDWNVLYDIAPQEEGVGFSCSSSTFPAQPQQIQPGSQSWLSMPQLQQDTANDVLTGAFQTVESQLKNSLTAISGFGSYVFPGAGTFGFTRGGVTSRLALYMTIQYLD